MACKSTLPFPVQRRRRLDSSGQSPTMAFERNFRRGCFSAAVAEASDRPELLERVRSTRRSALNPPASCLTFSQDAIVKATSSLLVQVMQGRRTDLPREALLCGTSVEDCLAALARWGCSYAPLYIGTLNSCEAATRAMMLLVRGVDRSAAAWAVRDAHRECPFIAMWHCNIEFLGFNSVPALVEVARTATQPLTSSRDDQQASAALRAALAEADPADAPTLRWWSAYVHLHAEEWSTAREILEDVLSDCTNGTWPPHYLPEAQYLAAMAEFGQGIRPACAQLLRGYFELAHALDRNRADALLLQLWAEERALPHPPSLRLLCRRVLAKGTGGGEGLPAQLELSSWDEAERVAYSEVPHLRSLLAKAWSDTEFATHSWVGIQAAKALRVDDGVSPLAYVVEAIERMWVGMPWRPPHVGPLLERMEASGRRGITVRFRRPEPRGRH